METYPDRPDQRRSRRRVSLVLVVVMAAVASALVARDVDASPPVSRTAMAVDTYRSQPPRPGPVVAPTPSDPVPSVPVVAPTTPPTSAAPEVTTVPPTTAAPPTTATPPTTHPPQTTSPPATTAPTSPPATAAAASAGYGCAAALAYLAAHAAPGFTFECPGNALGRQAMTCAFVAGVCPGTRIIAIADPCPAAYMNEAYNSRVAEGLAPGPFDPYGYCRN